MFTRHFTTPANAYFSKFVNTALFDFSVFKSSTKTYKMSEEMCSVARLLNLCDCKSGKRRVLKCFTKTKDISELSEFERDLLLLRSGLNSESVSTVCPYHQNFFLINNASYFYGVKKDICYNPFDLPEKNRKGIYEIFRNSFG
jgi:hypothetical protein